MRQKLKTSSTKSPTTKDNNVPQARVRINAITDEAEAGSDMHVEHEYPGMLSLHAVAVIHD